MSTKSGALLACICLGVWLLTSCEQDPTSSQAGAYVAPDSFAVPTLVNEWDVVARDEDDGFYSPGTSVVTPEGTLLVKGYRAFREYAPNGTEIGEWTFVLNGDTLGVPHLRYRYGKYFAVSYSPTQGNRLLVYNAKRRLIRATPRHSIPNAEIDFASLDADSKGNVYVLQFYEELVVKYDETGAFETEWPTHGSDSTAYSWPGGIAVSSDGIVYVSDTSHNRILVFSSTGELLDEWGKKGLGPGEFRLPTGLDSDRYGFLYVVDRVNERVQKFAQDGRYLAEFESNLPYIGGDRTPLGIAVGKKDVFVIHPGAYKIRRFAF